VAIKVETIELCSTDKENIFSNLLLKKKAPRSEKDMKSKLQRTKNCHSGRSYTQ
jgi:hypothetical protein